ncbi:MAG: alanine--glyoxylate aminotransferase family protein [Candidatus Dadabacteria bacterium]|nr:MAG: alanine--glyoxylate aminotransferase family protein [Candidatus Dadabacteria bacterium]
MNTKLLLTPGPTTIPERITEAMQVSGLHHRSQEFKKLFLEVTSGLKELLGCAHNPVLITGSGTAAMEASLAGVVPVGAKVLVLRAGKFGERWSEMAARLGFKLVELEAEYGSTFSPAEIEKRLLNNPDIKAVCFQYCETSTGAIHNAAEIISLTNKITPDALTLLDAITAIGTLEVNISELGADALIGGSQKALMLPPGLSFVALSDRAVQMLEQVESPAYYLNLRREFKSQLDGSTAWTPAISIIAGLKEALAMIREETPERVFMRHAQLAEATRSGLKELGFKLLAEECPAPGVTAAFPPAGINADELRMKLLKEDHIQIAGGQGKLKGKIIRVGHMGYVFPGDICRLFEAFESVISNR